MFFCGGHVVTIRNLLKQCGKIEHVIYTSYTLLTQGKRSQIVSTIHVYPGIISFVTLHA